MRKEFILKIMMFAGLAWFAACISEYEPKEIEAVRGLLVVEGTISNEVSHIRLSRSIGLLDDFTGEEYINNARVWIECSDGSHTADGICVYKGDYEITTGELNTSQQYRLCIEIYGQLYQSTYLAPLITPEIDALFWEKEGPGAPVKLNVSTHDPLEQSHFYSWSFKENWEVHSRFWATTSKEWIDGVETWLQYNEDDNIYRCWGRDSSRVFYLGSSANLSEYRIPRRALLEMQPSNNRISYLHHIAVEQKMLRKEAYDYFYNLQKNIESNGGVFAPMPSELRGNIFNVSNPDETVIGYIEVATITRMERYTDSSEGIYEMEFILCESLTHDDLADREDKDRYEMYTQLGTMTYYALRSCFDCRTMGSVRKNSRPDWWEEGWNK